MPSVFLPNENKKNRIPTRSLAIVHIVTTMPDNPLWVVGAKEGNLLSRGTKILSNPRTVKLHEHWTSLMFSPMLTGAISYRVDRHVAAADSIDI